MLTQLLIPSRDGDKLNGHQWKKDGVNKHKSLIIIYHGVGAHGLYPTVRYAAEFLAREGHIVMSCDMHGHGQSPGQPGYIGSPDQVGLYSAKPKLFMETRKGSKTKPEAKTHSLIMHHRCYLTAWTLSFTAPRYTPSFLSFS